MIYKCFVYTHHVSEKRLTINSFPFHRPTVKIGFRYVFSGFRKVLFCSIWDHISQQSHLFRTSACLINSALLHIFLAPSLAFDWQLTHLFAERTLVLFQTSRPTLSKARDVARAVFSIQNTMKIVIKHFPSNKKPICWSVLRNTAKKRRFFYCKYQKSMAKVALS